MRNVRNEVKIPFFLIVRHIKYTNKYTLVFIILLMSMAFINLIFVSSLFNGVIDSYNRQIIETSSGEITMLPAEGSDYITDWRSVTDDIIRVEGVRAASPRLQIPSYLKRGDTQGSWDVVAVVPEEEQAATSIPSSMVEGSYLEPGDTDGIVLGRQVAGGGDVEQGSSSLQGARVGDIITVSFGEAHRDFVVRGIYKTKFFQADQRAFITREGLHELDPSLDNLASNVLIRTTPKEEEEVLARLEESGIPGSFEGWQASAGTVKSITSSFSTINALLTIVGFIIAAVTIFIIIYVDISNNRQQIGILRAIGVKSYLVRITYIFQTVIYSLMGVLLGSLIFFAILTPYFRIHPFSLPIGDVNLVVNYTDFTSRAEGVILVSVLAGLIPAIIVTRARLLDEIRGR
jgi:putative ABC transport system permease protein